MTAEKDNSDVIPYEKLIENVTLENPVSFAPLSFGQTARYFREQAGITQEETARIAYVAKPTLSRIENSITRPTRRAVSVYEMALDMSKDDTRKEILIAKLLQEKAPPEAK